jgi:hypothetical protein
MAKIFESQIKLKSLGARKPNSLNENSLEVTYK